MSAGFDRWCEAAPKVAMALCEAGCPTEVRDAPVPGAVFFSSSKAGPELVFTHARPVAAIARKAFDLAGIGDLWHDDLASRLAPSAAAAGPTDEAGT